jgi:Ca2+-dependent lipid-binding protein
MARPQPPIDQPQAEMVCAPASTRERQVAEAKEASARFGEQLKRQREEQVQKDAERMAQDRQRKP